MDFNILETDVIIVGAGPSGLMMACQLLRFGVQPIIIDPRSSSSEVSSSIMLQARTLEIFRQLGLTNEVLANGIECKGVTIRNRTEHLDTIDFNDLSEPTTPFPISTIISQDQVEQVLINQLTLKACPIYWGTSLLNIEQDYQKVKVTLSNQRKAVSCNAKWIIGADGIDSKVRQSVGISFEGETYKRRCYVRDVELEKERQGYLHLFLSSDAFVSITLLPNSKKYRVMAFLPENLSICVNVNGFDQVINKILGFSLPMKDYGDVVCHLIHSKVATKLADQRCFLIGAAAHIYASLGGDEMNLGIQDAYNLGWKLANVIKGKQSAIVLQSYESERRHLVYPEKVPSYLFRFAIDVPKGFQKFRNYCIKKVYHFIVDNEERKKLYLSRLSQIGVNFRNSRLSVHHSISKKIKAGDRIPYLPIFDEKTKTETDLHTWCEKPGFTLIMMGNLSDNQLLITAKWIRQKYIGQMHLYYLPFSQRNQMVFDAFEIKKEAHKIVLVRPDMHIAYIQDTISANLIDNFMVEIMLWKY